MAGFIKTNSGSTPWSNIAAMFVKTNTGSTPWATVKKAFIKVSGGWQQFYPNSGPYTTASPFISSNTSGATPWGAGILFGSSAYGQRGTWVANSSTATITSYSYQILTSTSSTPGSGPYVTVVGSTALSGTYQTIDLTNSAYDDAFLIFRVTATRSDSVTGVDDTDSQAGTTRQYFIYRNIPVINTGSSITKGTNDNILTYSSTLNTSTGGIPDVTRSTVQFYRNTSSATTGGTLVSTSSWNSLSSTGPTMPVSGTYTTTATYDAGSDPTNNAGKYFYVVETQYNSGTDYNGGTFVPAPVTNKISYGPITLLTAPGAFTYSISDSTVTPAWTTTSNISLSGNTSNFLTVTWGTASPVSAYFITLSGTPVTIARTGNGTSTTYMTYYYASGTETAQIDVENNNTYCTITIPTASTNAISYVYDYSDGATRTTATTSATSYRFQVPNGNTATVYSVKAYLGSSGTGLSTTGTPPTTTTNTPTTKSITASASATLTYGTAPSNTSIPVISPSGGYMNNTYSCTTGSWSGSATITYTYQWQAFNNSTFVWDPLTGGTSSTYTPTFPMSLRCVVTGSNAYGSSSANATAVSITSPPAPTIISAPVITPSTGTTGTTFSCSAGSWNNSPTSYSYQWQWYNMSATPPAYQNLSGATSSSYTDNSIEQLRCGVIASNAGGSSSISYASSVNVTAPFSFTPFSFTPVFSFTPFGFTPLVFNFTPYTFFSFTPFSFTPLVFNFTPFGFTPFAFTPTAPFNFTPFGFAPFAFAPAFAFAPGGFNFNPTFNFTATNVNAPALPQEFILQSQYISGDTLVNTTDGLILIEKLSVGDKLLAINIDKLKNNIEKNSNVLNWNDKDLNIAEFTKIEFVGYSSVKFSSKLISINGDKFSEEHPILVYNGNVNWFAKASEIQKGWFILNKSNIESNLVTWEEVTDVSIDKQGGFVYSLSYDLRHAVFTEKLAIHNLSL